MSDGVLLFVVGIVLLLTGFNFGWSMERKKHKQNCTECEAWRTFKEGANAD